LNDYDPFNQGRAVIRYYVIQKAISSCFSLCIELENLKSTTDVEKTLLQALQDGGDLYGLQAEDLQAGTSKILSSLNTPEAQLLLEEKLQKTRSEKLFILKASMRVIAVSALGEFMGDLRSAEAQYNSVVDSWLHRDDVEYFLASRLQELKNELTKYSPGDQDSPEIYTQMLKKFLRSESH
jgi:ATP-dependent Lon protease